MVLLEFDFFGALDGSNLMMTVALVLLIIYFLWIYAWSKKQVGATTGLLLAILITWLLFYNYPELIWVPFLLYIWSIFGKDLLERVPKPR